MNKSDEGFNPENLSNKFKHANLEAYLRVIARERDKIVLNEFHAGDGYHIKDGRIIFGSTPKLASILSSSGVDYEHYPFEIRDEGREKLEEITSLFPNVWVLGDWKYSINGCINETDDKFVFVFDPTELKDYEELLPYLKPILKKGADVFMYLPITSDDDVVPLEYGKELVDKIVDIIKSENRKGVILKHPTLHGGKPGKKYMGRIDTHILVTEDPIAKLNVIHSHMMKVKENMKYERFKKFRDYITYIE